MNKKLLKVCEKLGWNIYEEEEDIYISQFSPLGEDFGFTVSKKNFVKDVKGYYLDFDSEEHADEWIRVKHETRLNVPQSSKALIEDAEDIEKMLEELSSALEEKQEKLKGGKGYD